MKRATVDDVMSWSPCEGYPRERVVKLFAERKSITHRGLAKLNISAEDRLWALIEYAGWSGNGNTLHEFACREAEDALKAAGVTNERSWSAIKTKRAWLCGEATDDELGAAWSAAWSAAVSAAEYAAVSADWSAAREMQVARLVAMLEASQ